MQPDFAITAQNQSGDNLQAEVLTMFKNFTFYLNELPADGKVIMSIEYGGKDIKELIALKKIAIDLAREQINLTKKQNKLLSEVIKTFGALPNSRALSGEAASI